MAKEKVREKVKEKVRKKETILVLSAHTDDFVIGAGGTIARYAAEGKKVLVVVFSYGERSHPWLKGRIVQRFRAREMEQAAGILGCKAKIFSLKEGKFNEEYQEKELEKTLLSLINGKKPSKIFTHSSDDAHPDHSAVHRITQALYEEINYAPKPEIYTYSIWNPISFKTHLPALYVDISRTFGRKLKALALFKSQRFNAIYPLMLFVFLRAILSGLKLRKMFGENFYRIR